MKVIVSLIIGLITILIIRLSVCLPAFSSPKKKKQKKNSKVKTLVIWGSGGHTGEMILLLKSLSSTIYNPVLYVLAETDKTSQEKILAGNLSMTQNAEWKKIIRSREVKQSWASTIVTTILSLFQCFFLVLKATPDVIICNGPGTCVPICYSAFLLKLLCYKDTKIVFVESFCRVEKLSLTGKLLYPIADKFLVQWPNLLESYKRAEFLGDRPLSN